MLATKMDHSSLLLYMREETVGIVGGHMWRDGCALKGQRVFGLGLMDLFVAKELVGG